MFCFVLEEGLISALVGFVEVAVKKVIFALHILHRMTNPLEDHSRILDKT